MPAQGCVAALPHWYVSVFFWVCVDKGSRSSGRDLLCALQTFCTYALCGLWVLLDPSADVCLVCATALQSVRHWRLLLGVSETQHVLCGKEHSRLPVMCRAATRCQSVTDHVCEFPSCWCCQCNCRSEHVVWVWTACILLQQQRAVRVPVFVADMIIDQSTQGWIEPPSSCMCTI